MCALRKCTPFVDVISLLETPVLEVFHNSFYLTAKLAEAIRRMNYSTDKSPNTSSVRLGDRFCLTIRQSFYGKIFGKMSRPRQCASDGLLLRSPVPDPILKRGGSATHKAPRLRPWHIRVPLVCGLPAKRRSAFAHPPTILIGSRILHCRTTLFGRRQTPRHSEEPG